MFDVGKFQMNKTPLFFENFPNVNIQVFARKN